MGKRRILDCLHRAVELSRQFEYTSSSRDGKSPFTDEVQNLPYCALATTNQTEGIQSAMTGKIELNFTGSRMRAVARGGRGPFLCRWFAPVVLTSETRIRGLI